MKKETDIMASKKSAHTPPFTPSDTASSFLTATQVLQPFVLRDSKSVAPSSPVERWLLQSLLRLLDHPPVRFCLWDNSFVAPPNCEARFTIHIGDRKAVYLLMSNPAVSFGDLYGARRLEVEGDLVEFMETVYLAFRQLQDRSPGLLKTVWRNQAPRSTSIRQARNNIHHHYDLGNEFYRLWLDREALQYTCAYFERPGLTLEQAQLAKLEHVCRKLMLRPGMKVVEAGSGWGGLACYMASKYGVEVTSYNISREQVQYARELAVKQGVADRVLFIEDDYRNITGSYDIFVSVGMLEHVGLENYRHLAKVIDRSLKPGGIGLIHSIGRNRPARMNGWIERRIFPGAYPPSIVEFLGIFEQGEFSVLDVENLRMHYAETLQHWFDRYAKHEPQVESMYDSEFVRMWRLYLAGSVAAFKVGTLQLFQVVFSRDRNNQLPRNRKHLYRKSPGVVSLFSDQEP